MEVHRPGQSDVLCFRFLKQYFLLAFSARNWIDLGLLEIVMLHLRLTLLRSSTSLSGGELGKDIYCVVTYQALGCLGICHSCTDLEAVKVYSCGVRRQDVEPTDQIRRG
jgi:hypothetical protein